MDTNTTAKFDDGQIVIVRLGMHKGEQAKVIGLQERSKLDGRPVYLVRLPDYTTRSYHSTELEAAISKKDR